MMLQIRWNALRIVLVQHKSRPVAVESGNSSSPRADILSDALLMVIRLSKHGRVETSKGIPFLLMRAEVNDGAQAIPG
jgi:hypothetical protein